ncbi:MAG: potassium transporter Kup [Oligoflexia bacterium]|nr:potassium transporter Kup [Oligoflexia bacterium]
MGKLVLGAIGVVFGDIGTSPLYAIKESFHPGHGIPLIDANVFGIISLVFWSLTLVVAIKYLAFLLMADNRGEGGVTALIALLVPRSRKKQIVKREAIVVLIGLFGAGLLYGDGIITPAISVLSAIEGLQVATPAFQPLVVPLTVFVLVCLFAFQRRGTGSVGAVFGPLTLLWFLTIAAAGLPWILRRPDILHAIDPRLAIDFFIRNGKHGFLVLSSIVLCITGAEALYADMGHFGRRPIRIAWYAIVFPALLINYFGQGALVLERGAAVIENTFYGLVSGWLLYPLVIIATVAAVIASQALITGAFSLSQQILQLGYCPRLTIRHTSRTKEGQIYVPKVNTGLAIGCISLVLVFQDSSALAGAYGVAVTGTMVTTSMLFVLVAHYLWRWRLLWSVSAAVGFLTIDFAFLSANLMKLLHGGWIPLLVAISLLTLMTTWKRGRRELSQVLDQKAIPLQDFIAQIERDAPPRVKGMAVFMTLSRNIAPSAILHHYRHNQVLHERVMLLSIIASDEPEVAVANRVRLVYFPQGFTKVVAMYGYMETPSVSEILKACEASGLPIDYTRLSFYLGRETFVGTAKAGMAFWRKRLFVLMSKNARSAAEYFNLPPDQVIEIGIQVKI